MASIDRLNVGMIVVPGSHRLIGVLSDDHNTMRTTLGANHADGNAIPGVPRWNAGVSR